MKHTQGPWKIIDINYHPYIEKDGFEVCQLFRTAFLNDDYSEDIEFENAKANANLIAAAPELLEALEQLLDCVINPDNFDRIVISDAQKAISKAKGE